MEKKGAKSSRNSERERIMLEEKPANFERLTVEFNAIYNSLLSNIRDRKTTQAQKKFLQLYELYRKISQEDLSDEELKILEQQLKEVSGLVPSEEPPQIALPLAIIAGVLIWALFSPSIIGMAAAGSGGLQIGTGIFADTNSVFQVALNKAPSRVAVTGRVFGDEGGRARIYLVDGGKELLIADERVYGGESFFLEECIYTCLLTGFDSKKITLIVRVENAAVEIDGITYN